MKIKPEDEITITTTYEELAKVYAVLGDCTGREVLWEKVKALLDPEQVLYNQFFLIDDNWGERSHYGRYSELWIKHLFKLETDEQRKLRELKEQYAALGQKIKELEDK